MPSPLLLERPGRWSQGAAAVLLLLVALPAAPLLWSALSSLGELGSSDSGVFVGRAFAVALLNSAVVALLVAALSLLLGLPAGVCLALYNFPGRRVLFALLVFPLLVPSFLWAIGWSSLSAHVGPAISGVSGCVIAFTSPAVALSLLASYAATQALTASQVDSARIAGGERTVIAQACRHAAIPTLLAASLAGVLTLQDPGPGQILGLKTAASEILTSFSALFDFALAGRQCAALTLLVLVITVPLACFSAPRIAHQILARQTGKPRPHTHRGVASLAALGIGLMVLISVFLPLLGLTLPTLRAPEFLRAWQRALERALEEVARTGTDTLVYAAGAAVISVTLSLLLVLSVGRDPRLRIAVVAACFILFSLPSALSALGILQIAAEAPAWADPLLRSPIAVCGALGLRFFPVATLLSLRAWGSTSSSWTMAAAVHGVSAGKYVWKVILPVLLPSLVVSALLVSLLATADVGTVLLLHPPGRSSLPLAIFTVMANARESLVATLCLLYAAIAVGLLIAAETVLRRKAT